MAKCRSVKGTKRKVCIGDLNKEIQIQNRDILEPIYGDVDFDENFTANVTAWAMIKTITGKTWFDGVSTDVNITHEIYIRYDSSITAESWVIYDSRRIDILAVEDLDEDQEFMKLTCTDRGLSANEATKA